MFKSILSNFEKSKVLNLHASLILFLKGKSQIAQVSYHIGAFEYSIKQPRQLNLTIQLKSHIRTHPNNEIS